MNKFGKAFLVFLVTHGEKEKGPDPDLSPEGRNQVIAILRQFGWTPDRTWLCGLGLRHLRTLELLGVEPYYNKRVRFHPLAGTSASPTGDIVTLSDTSQIAREQYLSPANEFRLWLESLLTSINEGEEITVVTSSENIVPFTSDGKRGKSGAVYQLTAQLKEGGYISWRLDKVFVANQTTLKES